MPDWTSVFEAHIAAQPAADASHDIGHLRRVLRLALKIAEIEGGDEETLVAAAYLHDLVMVPKSSPQRAMASRLAAEAARGVLVEVNFPAEKIDAVTHAIEAHSFSAAIPPTTREAAILQDADRLDAIGAIGIARCFHVAGQMGSSLFSVDDPTARARPLDDRRYALDHFETKLLRLSAGMNTEAGRKIAEARQALMLGFVAAMLDEIGAEGREALPGEATL